jgi:hypothetical protein
MSEGRFYARGVATRPDERLARIAAVEHTASGAGSTAGAVVVAHTVAAVAAEPGPAARAPVIRV